MCVSGVVTVLRIQLIQFLSHNAVFSSLIPQQCFCENCVIHLFHKRSFSYSWRARPVFLCCVKLGKHVWDIWNSFPGMRKWRPDEKFARFSYRSTTHPVDNKNCPKEKFEIDSLNIFKVFSLVYRNEALWQLLVFVLNDCFLSLTGLLCPGCPGQKPLQQAVFLVGKPHQREH